MSASKCSYIIFSNGGRPSKFKLELFGNEIPYDAHPRFLGITFDERLTFATHINDIKTKYIQRLNIIKIISHSSWKLNSKTLLAIYYALVRSVIEYLAFAVNITSASQKLNLQRIQNRAIKSIFKPSLKTNLEQLGKKEGVPPIEDRLLALFDCYVTRGLLQNNPLVCQLANEYVDGFESRTVATKTCLCHLKKVLIEKQNRQQS